MPPERAPAASYQPAPAVVEVVVQLDGKVGGQGGRPRTLHALGTQKPNDGTRSSTVATDSSTRQATSSQHTWSPMIAHGPQVVPAIVQTWVVPLGPHRVTVFTNETGRVKLQVRPVALVRVIVSVIETANVAFTKSSTPVGTDETNVELEAVTAHVAVVPASLAISRQQSSYGIVAQRLLKS